jgi:predicted DNA-binding protein
MANVSEVRLSFSFSNEMKEALQELADNDERNLSQYIRMVLADHLKKVNRKPRRRIKR